MERVMSEGSGNGLVYRLWFDLLFDVRSSVKWG